MNTKYYTYICINKEAIKQPSEKQNKMKTVKITNVNNETIEINATQEELFIDVATFDGNIDKCEIYTEDGGWRYLLNDLEEIEGAIDITEFENEILVNYFENHLFANEIHGN